MLTWDTFLIVSIAAAPLEERNTEKASCVSFNKLWKTSLCFKTSRFLTQYRNKSWSRLSDCFKVKNTLNHFLKIQWAEYSLLNILIWALWVDAFVCLTIADAGRQQSGVAVAESTGALVQGARPRRLGLSLQGRHDVHTVDVLQGSVQALHWEGDTLVVGDGETGKTTEEETKFTSVLQLR